MSPVNKNEADGPSILERHLQETRRKLVEETTARLRAERINRILFWISNAVSTTENLDELYRSIHEHLSAIIDLSNFYISLCDKARNAITFPYYVDEVDNFYEQTVYLNETDSLTGKVIATGKPMLLRHAELAEMAARNRLLGTPAQVWLGVPLKIRDEVIGIMSTQSYSNPDHFQAIDLEILNSVSEQVALAIERKRAEQRLKESEDKYRSILANIEDGYYEVDPEGNFTFFNQAMAAILGYSEAELAGRNFKRLADEANAAKIDAVFDQVRRGGQSIKTTDWQFLRKDGTTCYLECGVALVLDREGNPAGFRGIARDVTERIAAQEARKRLEERLQQSQRLEALGKLAGGIAHDFNNLLMGIQGRTSLLLSDTPRDHAHVNQLNGIEECVQSAANLTRRLLGFARGGKYDVKLTAINELAQRTVELFARAKKEIAVTTSWQPDVWTTEVDTSQIEQVLLNLFVNAWQAMPGGGRLTVETQNLAISPKECRPLGVRAGNYVRISVTDTGVGIDKDILPKVFDPFFTTREIGGGTGLGLASVYGIIKNHNGAVTVYSEKGRGSTFKIYLPATSKPIPREKPFSREEIPRGHGTVLLVDDEEMIIEVGRELLEMLGYTVRTAGSGREAIEVFERHNAEIDLVILDMIMPPMDGGEVYDRLKRFQPDVKVLLASGYSMNDQVLEILKRGCGGFIQKPFNIAQLSEKMREVLER